MRYRDTGEVHKDFHLATDTSIKYILRTYGIETLGEVFSRTAQRVYRDIYENLLRGNAEPFCEHLEYYTKREGGEYTRTDTDDTIEYRITKCPAVAHLTERGYAWSRDFCLQTKLMNDAWSEGTPFAISTEIESEGRCRQIVRRKNATE